MKSTKKYWKGLEQLKNTPSFSKLAEKEFPEYLPINESDSEPSRRDFLKVMGFGIGAVSLAACEAPIRNAIPYVRKPEDVDPSIPNYYASTFVDGSDYSNVVVKTREGRPIKIEGNDHEASFSGNGTTSQVEASVLSLYDKERLTGPLKDGASATWLDIDNGVGALNAQSRVAIVSNTIASPSTLAAVEQFKTAYPNTELITYDQQSVSGLLDANQASFGKRAYPSYDFSKADVIVSFASDFLGSSVNHTLYNKQFAATRKLGDKKKTMSRLYSFESNLSLTGANADYRFPVKASELTGLVADLYEAIVGGGSAKNEQIRKVASDLKGAGRSLVVAGSNDVNVQVLVNAINNALGNYGTDRAIDLSNATNIRKGDDKAFAAFVNGLKGGQYNGVIFYNCNPVYDHPLGAELKGAISKAQVSISTSDRMDETTESVKLVAPDNHYLESWNDFELSAGTYSLSQPTISKIFDTRQAQESFLTWGGDNTKYYDFIRTNWATVYAKDPGSFTNFNSFWDKSLQDGVRPVATSGESVTYDASVESGALSAAKTAKVGAGLELVLYVNSSVGNGRQANNPWLQEMPDPITKACWDNYLTVSPKQAEEWGIKTDDGRMSTQKVSLSVNGQTLSVPVLPQPGQAYNTMGLALGYGRTKAGKVGDGIGVNAYPLIATNGGVLSYDITSGVTAEPNGEAHNIAQTQTSQTFQGRENVIQETVLKAYQQDPSAGRSSPRIATSEGFKKPSAVSLWKGHKYANHHWGMAIDLNSCTGCGTCTIACQTENNIPVVGKQEVINRREMHWIRIDRYYSHDPEQMTEEQKSKLTTRYPEFAAYGNPEVTFQPMMCQQCNNAPCETVCPVAATTHSSEGLNQMAYNRCIGTRYCANNCPYKVRRFNWFKYHDNEEFGDNLAMNNDLGKMVLNPDVTVRARGVMEKCTFCVQRIQAGKLEAKRNNERPKDGDINVACAKSCPTDALVFGDMKDPESRISKLLKIKSMDKGVEAQEDRAYHVLEELRVMPNIWYLTKVRNKDEEKKSETAESTHA